MYALYCPIRVKPEHLDAFIRASIYTGSVSRREEPGCLRYDVSRDRAEPDCICFYEVYSDEQAFNAHIASAHYQRWEMATEGMIEEELQWATLDLLNPPTSV